MTVTEISPASSIRADCLPPQKSSRAREGRDEIALIVHPDAPQGPARRRYRPRLSVRAYPRVLERAQPPTFPCARDSHVPGRIGIRFLLAGARDEEDQNALRIQAASGLRTTYIDLTI